MYKKLEAAARAVAAKKQQQEEARAKLGAAQPETAAPTSVISGILRGVKKNRSDN